MAHNTCSSILNLRLIFIISHFFYFISISLSSAEILHGTVVKVTDGDTVTIVDDKGFSHRVRLAGIDAPEKNQPYGEESTKNLGWLVYKKRVNVEYFKYDRYGRIVGKIRINPKGDQFCLLIDCIKKLDVGLEQIKVGMAWHYKKYENEQTIKNRSFFSSAERKARKSQIGLWKNKSPIPPWKWRRDNRLKALKKAFEVKGIKKKKYAQEIGVDPDQLNFFLDEAVINEDEAIKKAFEESGLEEEEFAAKFNISPKKLESVLSPK
jgi:endonuclease YncB( thermonuclease family)